MPPGFHVTTEAYRTFVAGFRDEIDPGDPEHVATLFAGARRPRPDGGQRLGGLGEAVVAELSTPDTVVVSAGVVTRSTIGRKAVTTVGAPGHDVVTCRPDLTAWRTPGKHTRRHDDQRPEHARAHPGHPRLNHEQPTEAEHDRAGGDRHRRPVGGRSGALRLAGLALRDDDPRDDVGKQAYAAGQHQGDRRDPQQQGVDVQIAGDTSANPTDHAVAPTAAQPSGLDGSRRFGNEPRALIAHVRLLNCATRASDPTGFATRARRSGAASERHIAPPTVARDLRLQPSLPARRTRIGRRGEPSRTAATRPQDGWRGGARPPRTVGRR